MCVVVIVFVVAVDVAAVASVGRIRADRKVLFWFGLIWGCCCDGDLLCVCCCP